MRRRGAEEGEEFKGIRRGWCLGEETFRKELLAQMSGRLGGGALRAGAGGDGGSQGGADHRGGLEAAAVAGRGLEAAAQGRPVKVALAARLRSETTLTVAWIAERLCMGTRDHLNHLLYRRRKAGRE